MVPWVQCWQRILLACAAATSVLVLILGASLSIAAPIPAPDTFTIVKTVFERPARFRKTADLVQGSQLLQVTFKTAEQHKKFQKLAKSHKLDVWNTRPVMVDVKTGRLVERPRSAPRPRDPLLLRRRKPSATSTPAASLAETTHCNDSSNSNLPQPSGTTANVTTVLNRGYRVDVVACAGTRRLLEMTFPHHNFHTLISDLGPAVQRTYDVVEWNPVVVYPPSSRSHHHQHHEHGHAHSSSSGANNHGGDADQALDQSPEAARTRFQSRYQWSVFPSLTSYGGGPSTDSSSASSSTLTSMESSSSSPSVTAISTSMGSSAASAITTTPTDSSSATTTTMDSSATAATIATTTPTTTSTTTTTDTTPTASANATTITSSSTPTPDPTSLAWSPIAKSFNLGAAYLDNFQIEAYLHALADMYPHLITLGTLGNSYEGRPLYYVRLTAPIANDTARPAKVGSTWTLSGRPGILMTSGMHAREWIAPSVILNLLDIWTAGYGGDSLLTDLLSGFEMIIVPMLNPDGYVWSWQLNRLWRKTTQLFAGGCMGVDLNRNFPASDWIDPENLNASSPDPCDDTFRGPYPGSAPETKALVNFVADYQAATGNMMQFVVDTHSYNLLWLYSPEYDCSVAQSDSEANRGYVAEMAISAIYAVGGEVYTAGRICEVLYPTSGSTVEWAQEKYSISNSFAVELRDDGTHGFLLPPDQIVPSVAEINMGILTAIAYSDTAAPSTVV